MYCSSCTCNVCLSKRLIDTNDKTIADVVRLVIKSGEKGMTKAELCEASRKFRAVDESAKDGLLDGLVNSGLMIMLTFKAPTRGKPRVAYLAVDQKI